MLKNYSDALPGGGIPSAELRRQMEATEHRCRTEGLPFFLLAIGYAGEARQEAEEPGIKQRIHAALLERIAELPRAEEYLIDLEAGRLLIVVPDMPTEAAEVIAQLLIAGARDLVLEGASEPRRVGLEIGLALQQERELHFETLVLVASEGAQVAHARGGECAIHSELYGLLQNRVERRLREQAGDPAATVESPELPLVDALAPEAERLETLSEPPVPDEQARLAAQLQSLVQRDADRRSRRELEEALKRAAENYAAEAVAKVEAERLRMLENGELPAPAAAPQVANADPTNAAASIKAPKDRGQVERLERRLKKLVATLEETERRLDEVSRQKGVELGVASAYRGFQGLTGEEQHFELKREMMRELLDANLRLRADIGGSGSAA